MNNLDLDIELELCNKGIDIFEKEGGNLMKFPKLDKIVVGSQNSCIIPVRCNAFKSVIIRPVSSPDKQFEATKQTQISLLSDDEELFHY